MERKKATRVKSSRSNTVRYEPRFPLLPLLFDLSFSSALKCTIIPKPMHKYGTIYSLFRVSLATFLSCQETEIECAL